MEPREPRRTAEGLTRRGLLKRHAGAGAGLLAGNALLAGALAAPGAADPALTIRPRLYPLSSFTPEIDLSGKVAVVTGASTGIGRATGEALAARGARVIGTSRDAASVEKRPRFTLMNLDVANAASVDSFVKRLRRKLGAAARVDILVNNAGRGIIGDVVPPAGQEARYFRQLELGFRTDYSGHVMMTERMRPLLPRSGYARVYFTVSITGYSVSTGTFAYLHAYAAMKRALLAFANAWRSRLEQAQSNIGVATISPYLVDTRWPDNLILTEKVRKDSAVAAYIRAMRELYSKALPPSLVGEAYWQLLSTARPPANVAAGSAEEPYASMGANALADATLLAENVQAAAEFGC
jgi:NAD(P)-dependent dehydrogenase (short-subunit alcohol dehydrogenase family)